MKYLFRSNRLEFKLSMEHKFSTNLVESKINLLKDDILNFSRTIFNFILDSNERTPREAMSLIYSYFEFRNLSFSEYHIISFSDKFIEDYYSDISKLILKYETESDYFVDNQEDIIKFFIYTKLGNLKKRIHDRKIITSKYDITDLPFKNFQILRELIIFDSPRLSKSKRDKFTKYFHLVTPEIINSFDRTYIYNNFNHVWNNKIEENRINFYEPALEKVREVSDRYPLINITLEEDRIMNIYSADGYNFSSGSIEQIIINVCNSDDISINRYELSRWLNSLVDTDRYIELVRTRPFFEENLVDILNILFDMSFFDEKV